MRIWTWVLKMKTSVMRNSNLRLRILKILQMSKLKILILQKQMMNLQQFCQKRNQARKLAPDFQQDVWR